MDAWYHLPPSPHPSLSITVGNLSSLWHGGMVAQPPDPNPLPPRQTLTSVFLYKLPIVNLSHAPPPPHPHPSPSITVGHPSSLWHGGVVAHPPDPNPPLPPKH
jgi:hypothetical protein